MSFFSFLATELSEQGLNDVDTDEVTDILTSALLTYALHQRATLAELTRMNATGLANVVDRELKITLALLAVSA